DRRSYITRLDFVSPSGKNKIFLRGSLADYNEDATAQQFPGQPAAQTLLTNSGGTSLGHTWVVNSNLINVGRWGFTQQDLKFTGGSTSPGLRLREFYDIHNFDARNNSRKTPTHNLTDDLTWVKGKHTLQFGMNYRNIHNKRS